MKRLIGNRVHLWLLATLALLVLAACGQTPTPDPAADNHTVTVAVTGDGSVTGLSGDLDCTAAGEDTCVATVDDGTQVTLTAAANVEGESVTWGGDCDGETGDTCTLTVNDDVNVTAAFAAAEPAGDPELTVNAVGGGTVDSTPAGIEDCSATCTATFESGESVTLTATAAVGGDPFVGWSGDECAGSSDTTCTFDISQDTEVTATFGSFSTDYRRAYSADTSLPNAAELSVTFTPVSGAQETITRSVAQADHDAEELLLASSQDASRYPEGHTFASSDLELGYDPNHGPQLVGLLFQNLNIPADATIDSAHITFTAYASPSVGEGTEVTVTIEGQDSVDPAAFAQDAETEASSDISTRTTVTTTVDWTINTDWTADATEQSADIASIVAEVISSGTWNEADNGIVFIISPVAGAG